MRFAIFSDIHANLHAWKAVLLDARSAGAETLICLGDIVGYGPHPREVLDSIRHSANYIVQGNHDAALSGLLDADLFNDAAREALEWSRVQLDENAVDFLRALPLVVAGKGFRCTHAEFVQPARFDYILRTEDAHASWASVDEPLLFVGHTHEAQLFVTGSSGRAYALDPRDFEVEPGKRYIVNVGSVGQPRDGDARASYCLYDSESQTVTFRRIPFDLDAYCAAVDAAGLPARSKAFMAYDRRNPDEAFAPVADFNPPEAAKVAAGPGTVQTIEGLQGSVRRWRRSFAGAIAAFCVAAILAGGLSARHVWRAETVTGPSFRTVDARYVDADTHLLTDPALPGSSRASIAGWQLHLGSRYRQAVSVKPDQDESLAFRLESASDHDELRLRSPNILVRPGMKLQLRAQVLYEESFEGSVAALVSLEKEGQGADRSVEEYIVREANLPRRDGWLALQTTFELPADAQSVSVSLRGRFTGSCLVRELQLLRK